MRERIAALQKRVAAQAMAHEDWIEVLDGRADFYVRMVQPPGAERFSDDEWLRAFWSGEIRGHIVRRAQP